MDLKDIEKLMKAMTKYQVSSIKMEGLEIQKNLHLNPKAKDKPTIQISPAPLPVNYSAPEDVLFLNSKAPKLSLDEWDRFSSNSPKPLKDN